MRAGRRVWTLFEEDWGIGTFVLNHARDVLACDFFVTVTATFRVLYVFVVLDVDTRRLLHWNVTEHPTAAWTVQRFRAPIMGESAHPFLVHDHDTVFSNAVDRALSAMGGLGRYSCPGPAVPPLAGQIQHPASPLFLCLHRGFLRHENPPNFEL